MSIDGLHDIELEYKAHYESGESFSFNSVQDYILHFFTYTKKDYREFLDNDRCTLEKERNEKNNLIQLIEKANVSNLLNAYLQTPVTEMSNLDDYFETMSIDGLHDIELEYKARSYEDKVVLSSSLQFVELYFGKEYNQKSPETLKSSNSTQVKTIKIIFADSD
uniref:Conserved domain protein n=1 Tax=Rhabditophanes sp. KR3021 TaxID=114890 RepID=A0AC35TX03_9BILA